MKIADLDEIVEIERNLFSDAWKKSQFEYELIENCLSDFYVLEENDEIVAYCGVWHVFEREEIVNVAVKQEHQGKGYGKLLMNHLIDKAINDNQEIISLEVRVSNEKALNLYKKLGFEVIRTRKSYYEDHEDAYEMMKVIGGLNEESFCD